VIEGVQGCCPDKQNRRLTVKVDRRFSASVRTLALLATFGFDTHLQTAGMFMGQLI